MGAANQESLVTSALHICVFVHFLSWDQQNAKYKYISYSEVRYITEGATMRIIGTATGEGAYVMLASLRYRFVVNYRGRRFVPQLLCYIRHLTHSSRQQCEQIASAEPLKRPMWFISVCGTA